MAILSAQFASAVALIAAASLCLIDAKQAGIGVEIGSRGGGGQREFDYFNLALQWPGTFCQRTRYCCSSNACCRGSNGPTVFTIHGLWPDYNDGTWPACCTQKTFDEKEISTLHDALEKYWPSLSCGKPSSCHGGKGSFWGHEWEKHGTCSSPVVGDEYNYFLTTLNVYFKYNVTQILNEAGYVPSNTEKYPLGGIVSAIQNVFRATPKLVCKKGAVEELHLCFYKDFKPRDCLVGSGNLNDKLASSSSCPNYVSIPAYASLGHGGGETEISSA
ncbi:ribonuclease 2-like [Pyrus ussuriensis x Pyrus communis]|uniref:Ribonuclease 2-like n=1 Tax=Pyrus ussuriensis x Pyrus communis TaxID=2448454 RepID=A0A5N5FH90_9ROSA|nr:ribonuclease 2 [Pyrus x bretschneideri]KAB2602495.1 ribonuclease 2-like [Pyrus ussuriensis x Pyrus communis]